MSEHQRFREMLARRAELPPQDEGQLRLHLDGCPECRQTAEVYGRQTILLRSLPAVDAPAGLRAGVLAGIRNVAPVPFWRRPLFALVPVAAAILVVAGSAALLNRPRGSSNHSAVGVSTPTPALTAPTVNAVRKPTTVPTHTPPVGHPTTRPTQSGSPPQPAPTPLPGSSGSGEIALGATPGGATQSQPGTYAAPPQGSSVTTPSSGANTRPVHGSGSMPAGTSQPQNPNPTSPTCCTGPAFGSTKPTSPPAPQPASPRPTAAPTHVLTSPVAPGKPTGTPVASQPPTISSPGTPASTQATTPVPTPTPTPGAGNPPAVATTPVPPPVPVP